MADIITRLILKSDAFDANLKRAKGSVNSYQNDILSVAKTAGAGIMKFAGTIGVAVGAYEGFNKLMNSSQTLSDEYNRTIEGLKGAVDNFFYSIGSGSGHRFLMDWMKRYGRLVKLTMRWISLEIQKCRTAILI